MKLNNYDYNNKAPISKEKKFAVSPGYLIFFIVILLVFIFVLVLLIGVRRGAGKEKSSKEEVTTEETNIVKYEGYAEQINSIFSDVYGYNYNIAIQASPDNAYFLKGIMKEAVSNKDYSIDGTIVERGVCGYITSEALSEEAFAFTKNGSFLDANLYEYIQTLPSDDPRREYKGYESGIDIGYSVSGPEVLRNLSDVLINSKYKDEKSSDGSFTVTYPEGALRADTGREFFDGFINNYPGDLTLTVRIEENDTVRQVYIDGSGSVSFNIMMLELKSLSNYDPSLIDSAYSHNKNKEDPFKKSGEDIALEEYIQKYSK